MALETKLHLTQQQRLALTPELQQSIALLQKNRAELIEAIRDALVENPVLDAEESGTILPREEDALPYGKGNDAEAEFDAEGSEDFASYMRSLAADPPSSGPGYSSESSGTPSMSELVQSEPSLQDHLIWQLEVSATSAELHDMGAFIIGHIDQSGYLAVPLEEIAALGGAEPALAEKALALIQTMDPAGVGARDVRECLLLQLRAFGMEGGLAERMVRDHLPLVQEHRWDDVARVCGETEEAVRAAYEVIQHLHPKPGFQFSTSRTVVVVPDAYVYRAGNDYKISLNDDGLPKLRISSSYRSMLGGPPSTDATDGVQTFLSEKIRHAEGFIKSVYQRQRTIRRVVETIVQRQKGFLDHGPAFLQPMRLQDVADELDMHPSTVSRVVREKYVHTPRGLFEMRFFFNAPIASSEAGGEAVSSVQVKEVLGEIIAAENSARPMSDSRLVARLAERGITLARRTVAKYREELNIQSSSRRKRRVP